MVCVELLLSLKYLLIIVQLVVFQTFHYFKYFFYLIVITQ